MSTAAHPLPPELREPDCPWCLAPVTVRQQLAVEAVTVEGIGIFHRRCATATMVQIERAVERVLASQ